MWKDCETKIDYLNMGHIVQILDNIVLDDNLTPAIIGVYGAWGSGKSSILTMSEQGFLIDEKVLSVKFNSWMFEDYFDIRAALISTIISDMSKKLSTKKGLIEKAKNLVKSINIFGLIKKGLGYGLDIALNKGANIIEGLVGEKVQKEDGEETETSLRESIKEFSNIFSEIFLETGLKRVVVYIDELDRCSPEKIIDVLESIRLFAFVPGISFVIGADERLIKYAVDCKYENLPGNDVSIGKEYLDKLIQYTIYIPVLTPEEMANYICLLYIENSEIGNKERLIESIIDQMKDNVDYRFVAKDHIEGLNDVDKVELRRIEGKAHRMSMIFELGFQGNPRKCKRFLNNLSMRLSVARLRKLDIDEAYLCKLMMLEYYKPEIFNTLVVEQRNNKGVARCLKGTNGMENDPYIKYREDEWFKEWLKNEPDLCGVDLGKYIYVSRTNHKLGAISVSLSAFAEVVYKNLMGGALSQKTGKEQIDKLTEDEAIAVFEKIEENINISSEDCVGKIKILLELSIKKTVLKNRMIEYLNQLKQNQGQLSFAVNEFKKHYCIEQELAQFDKAVGEDKTIKKLRAQLKKGEN